jgi:cold shock protein
LLASELREQVFSAGLEKVPIRVMPQGGARRVSRKQQGMATGTVKFFNDQKGFGFISREDGPDVFVHFSNIEGNGYRSLEEGQTVEFEVGQGRKGDEALKVTVV